MIADNPFSDATYSQINKTLADIMRAKKLLESVERCGYPCQEVKDQLAASEMRFNAVKREFFSDRP